MSDVIGVKCRSCGEINFVPLEPRDFVQVGVPIADYDAVIRVLRRRLPKASSPRTSRSTATEAERERAISLRKGGMTVREVMVEMGWSLGKTARIIGGISRGDHQQGDAS